MKRLSLILSIALLFGVKIHADIFMKQNQHTGEVKMMGQTQPAKDVVQEIWMTKDGFRMESSETTVIYRKNKNVMMILNNQNKTYREMNLGDMDFSEMAGGETGQDAEQFSNMMKTMMKMDVTVTPTSESRKIGEWNCKKYTMTIQMAMGTTTMEIWATKDLKVDPALVNQLNAGMLAAMPGMQQAAAQIEQEMKKIEGVKVLTLQSMMMMGQEIKSETRLIEYKEAKAPEGFLDIPSGYTKQTGPGF